MPQKMDDRARPPEESSILPIGPSCVSTQCAALPDSPSTILDKIPRILNNFPLLPALGSEGKLSEESGSLLGPCRRAISSERQVTGDLGKRTGPRVRRPGLEGKAPALWRRW